MNTLTLKLDEIWTGDRLRDVDADWATALAESIRAQGLLAPIQVRATPDQIRPYALVAGAHRLAAMELLGRETIPAILFDGDEFAAQLWEIDENLMRHELSALDRATFMAARKAVYEARHPLTKRGGDRRSDQTGKNVVLVPSFSEDTAKRLGFDKRTIERAIRRHAALHADVRRRLTGTWLVNHAQQLDLLASCKHSEQIAAAEMLFGAVEAGAKRPKSVGDALDIIRDVIIPPHNKDDEAFAKFLSLWRKGSPALHRRIRAFTSKDKS